MKDLIKELNVINLNKEEILVVKMPINTPHHVADNVRASMQACLEGTVMVFVGDVDFEIIKEKGDKSE